MSTQLERLNRLFEFLVRVQEFWIQPWTRLEQLPWSSTLQTSSEGAPLRVAPSAPLFPALSEVLDLVSHEDFRMGLGLEWLEGPGVDCPFSFREVRVGRVDSDIELVPVGGVRRRVELLRHLGLSDPPRKPYQLRPCQVLFVEPLSLNYTKFFSRLKKAIQDVDDLPASLAYFTGPSPAKPEPTYRQPLWALSISPEQEEVVRRLAVRPLVVVEGGPGTGKSHLTTNLLSHCLALGQRVLVTGPSAASLRPVLDRLPADLRDLCVGPDEDPQIQLQRLLKRLETVDAKNMLKEAEKLKRKREDLADEQSRLEGELLERVLREYGQYHGLRVGELGRQLQAEREEHGWIPGPVGLRPMPLTHAEVEELYESNRMSTEEEESLAASLPDRGELLSIEELASLQQLWREAESFPDHNFWSGTPPPETLYFLPAAAEVVVASLAACEPWFLELIWRARTSDKHRQTFINLLKEVEQNRQDRARIAELIGDRKPHIAYADEEAQEVCLELIDHVNRGGTVTGIAATFLKPRWKKFLKGVSVRGKSPVTESDFRALLEAIALRRLEASEDARWAQEMILLGLMTAEQKEIDRVDALKRALNWSQESFADFERQAADSGLLWERAIELSADESGSGRVLRRLLTFLQNELEPLLERRQDYLKVCALIKRADQQVRYLKTGGKASSNPVWDDLRKALVKRDVEDYQAALNQLSDWEKKAPRATRRRDLLQRLESVAPAWADAVARREGEHGGTRPPGDVALAWEHRQGAQWLKTLQEEEGSEALHAELARTRAEWEAVTREMVHLRAWAVQHMRLGKREDQSPEDGLPAWIVPLDQVVERFAPDETRFDLLVIDHAGLVDLRATGLLALGERALVLGDPERMAAEPTAQPQDLASLASPFLAEHPRARTSSLLTWLDQGDSLRLTQPYRSRPEMLHLLRALESSVAPIPGHPPEHPNSPIVLHRVRLSPTEVTALACAATRELPDHSLGVICADPMLARKVRRLLHLALPPGRAPLVGSPFDLQGEERDLMLVVMQDGDRDVVSPADRRRLTTALGMAREQIWLLYSVDPAADDLRLQLLNEADGLTDLALAPGHSTWRGLAAQALKKAGYRVHPFDERSVRVQGRLGWVILSMYGETGQAPTRADIIRENWLEQNLGWRYLRLRASRFWLDPEAVLREVIETVTELALTPLDAEVIDLLTLRMLKTAQDLRKEMPPTPGTALSLVSSYTAGDFNWVWHPLVRRLLLERVAVAPVDAEGYAIEVERGDQRLVVANRDFEDVDVVVDLSSLEGALSTVLEALGPAAPPLPRPTLVQAMAPGWEGPLVEAPIAAPEAVWEEQTVLVEGAPVEVAEPSSEAEPEPVAAAAEPAIGWETSTWMDSRAFVTASGEASLEAAPAEEAPPEILAKASRKLEFPSKATGEPKAPEAPAPPPEPKPALSLSLPEPKPAPVARAEARPVAKVVPLAEPTREPEPEPKAKPKPEPEAKPKPEPEAKPKPEPEAKAKPEPEAKAKPEPEAKPKPEPEAKAKPEPARPEPKTKPEPRKAEGRKAPSSPPAFFTNSGRFEFGAARPAARSQKPAGEPTTPGDRPTPPPPPRATPSKQARADAPVPEEVTAPAKSQPEQPQQPPVAQEPQPAVRPPAPKSRPGPPKTTFTRKAPPKPEAPAPAEGGVDAIRTLMLQAFELIEPISKQTLSELVEGVNAVALERASGAEQRRAPRLLCCYDVKCETDREKFEAVVSEVSLTGVRLELATRLSRDAIVVLAADVGGNLAPVRCQVKWCRRSAEGLAAGLAFAEEPEALSRSWVAVLLHSLGFGPEHTHQRRKSLRVPTPRLRVQLEGPFGKGLGVALDLGVGGMLIETVARLTLEDRLQLTLGPHDGLPTITVQARVANRRERKTPAFGLAFQDLTPSSMKALGSYVLSFLAQRAKGKRA